MTSSHANETHFTEEERRYLVEDSGEVVSILRATMDKASMVTVYCDSSADFAITSLLDVSPEEDQLVFDVPAARAIVERLKVSRQLTFVTNLNGVKIKFQAGGARATTHDGRAAFVTNMPTEVVRLQRRESYRVSCPLSKPVKCTIPYGPQGQGLRAEFVVLDVSQGGLAISGTESKIKLEPGDLHKDCVIVLPEVGSFRTLLEVRSVQQVTMKNGQVTVLSHCRFVDPERGGLTTLQRYTMRLERERTTRF